MERNIIKQKDVNDNFILSCGVNNYENAKLLSWHKHIGFEVTFVIKGETWWELENNQSLCVKKNKMSIMKDNVPHRGYNDMTYPCEMVWIIFNHNYIEKIYNDKNALNNILSSDNITVEISADVKEEIIKLKDEICSYCQGEKLGDTQIIKFCVYKLLLLANRAVKIEQSVNTVSDIEKLKNFIGEHYFEPISIEMLANVIAKSKVSVNTIFNVNEGITPLAYINIVRLEKGRELLEKGEDGITEIAYKCCFANSQHFATNFKKHYGYTPTQYRKMKK